MTRPITYYVPLTGKDLSIISGALEEAVARIKDEPALLGREVTEREFKAMQELLKRLA